MVHAPGRRIEGPSLVRLELAMRVLLNLARLCGKCLAQLRLNLIVDTIYRAHRLISTYRLRRKCEICRLGRESSPLISELAHLILCIVLGSIFDSNSEGTSHCCVVSLNWKTCHGLLRA